MIFNLSGVVREETPVRNILRDTVVRSSVCLLARSSLRDWKEAHEKRRGRWARAFSSATLDGVRG